MLKGLLYVSPVDSSGLLRDLKLLYHSLIRQVDIWLSEGHGRKTGSQASAASFAARLASASVWCLTLPALRAVIRLIRDQIPRGPALIALLILSDSNSAFTLDTFDIFIL